MDGLVAAIGPIGKGAQGEFPGAAKLNIGAAKGALEFGKTIPSV